MSNKLIVIGADWCTVHCPKTKKIIEDRGYKFEYIADYESHPRKDEWQKFIDAAGGKLPTLVVGDEAVSGLQPRRMLYWIDSKNIERPGAFKLGSGREYDTFRYIHYLVSATINNPGSGADFSGWPKESKEERINNMSFSINGKGPYSGLDAFKKLLSGMIKGLFSLKQIKTLQISHEKGSPQGSRQTINIGKDWWEELNTMATLGKGIPGVAFYFQEVPGLGSKDSKKAEKGSEAVEAELQEIINDVRSINEGDGMGVDLSKFLDKCALSPSDSGRGVSDIYGASADYLLSGVATSFAGSAATKSMLDALRKAQGTKAGVEKISKVISRLGRPGKVIGKTINVFKDIGAKSTKAGLATTGIGAAAVGAYALDANKEATIATGGYVWLHVMANVFGPGKKIKTFADRNRE